MTQTTRNVQPVITNLGREGADELVSSRYAVRVGDVDVVLISDGILDVAARPGKPVRRPVVES